MDRHTVNLKNTGFRFPSLRLRLLKYTMLAREQENMRTKPEELHAGQRYSAGE